MPRAPTEKEADAAHFPIETQDEHMVAHWANMPITQVGDLPLLLYLRLRRDAFIFQLEQTEEGHAYLNEAWVLSQTKPDREAARALFG